MMPGTYNLSFYQGDSWRVTATLNQPTSPVSPVDLTGYAAKAQLRSAKSSTVVALEFTCTIASPSTGIIVMTASPTLTKAVLAAKYYWDLQISKGDEVQTILAGYALVTGEITRS